MNDSKIKWTCSLNNGETIYEEKGNYKKIDGEKSPWLRLQDYIEKNNLQITSLSLYNDKNERWNLHSAGNNPKFSAFDNAKKPIGYKFFKKMGADIVNGKQESAEFFVIIEADYGDFKLQTWVKDNTNISWSFIC